MEGNRTRITPLPRLSEAIEHQAYGGRTVATANGRIHLLLDEAEMALVAALDGTHSIETLSQEFGPDTVGLLNEFEEAGLLADSSPLPDDERFAVTGNGLEFTGFDRIVAFIYRMGGRFLLTWPAHLAMVAVAILGPIAVLTAAPGEVNLDPIGTLVVLVVSGYLATFLHETAHALVLEHHGRRIGRAGFGFYWGAVAFFVDASDALMLPKRTRIVQALAGPFADAVLGGALAIAALASPSPLAAALLIHLAVLQWLAVLDNLVPLLELDGYWVLADLLDEPDLHSRAGDALHRAARGESSSPALAFFGLASLVFGMGLTVFGLWIWVSRFGPLVLEALQSGPLGVAVAALFAGPLAAGLISGAVHAATTFTKTERGGELT